MSDASIDRDAMGRLAKALDFILGANHATTAALRKASETGAERDIKAARAAFVKLKSSDRQAAMALIKD